MKETCYRFDSIRTEAYGNYFLQISDGKMLTYEYHTHDFYEIILVLGGSCTELINGKLYTMREGNFFFLRPGDCHMARSQTENANLVFLSVEREEFLRFAAAYGEPFLNRLNESAELEMLEYGSGLSALYERCRACFIALRPEYECKLLLCVLIKRFLDLTLEQNGVLPPNLARALWEMRQPENVKAGLPAMLRISNYSHAQLSRLMKRYLNTTLHAYVRDLRLNAAYNSLVFTSDAPEEIAEETGYASFSHFCKIFKERFGITPAALRRKIGAHMPRY